MSKYKKKGGNIEPFLKPFNQFSENLHRNWGDAGQMFTNQGRQLEFNLNNLGKIHQGMQKMGICVGDLCSGNRKSPLNQNRYKYSTGSQQYSRGGIKNKKNDLILLLNNNNGIKYSTKKSVRVNKRK